MINKVLVNPPNKWFKWDHDFEMNLMHILHHLKEDSLLLTVFWIDQCNFVLSPDILKKMTQLEITLCITTQEDEENA